MLATLLKKASGQKGCFDALIRVRRKHEHSDLFLDGWYTAGVEAEYITLRRAVNLQERKQTGQ